MAQIAELEHRVQQHENAHIDNAQTLRWVVKRLAVIAAVQQEHTLHFIEIEEHLSGVEGRLGAVESRLDGVEGRLGAVESCLDGIESRLGAVEKGLHDLRKDLPEMIASTMREVLHEQPK